MLYTYPRRVYHPIHPTQSHFNSTTVLHPSPFCNFVQHCRSEPSHKLKVSPLFYQDLDRARTALMSDTMVVVKRSLIEAQGQIWSPLCLLSAPTSMWEIRYCKLRQRHPILSGCQGQLRVSVDFNTAMTAHMSILLLLTSMVNLAMSVQFHPRNPTHLPSFPVMPASQRAAQNNVSTTSSPIKGWVRRKAGLKPDKRNRRPRKLLLRRVKKLLPKKEPDQKKINGRVADKVTKGVGGNLSLADSLNKTLLLKNGARDRGSRFLSLFTVVRFIN